MAYLNLAGTIGNTPLVRLTRLPGLGSNTLLAKLEGNNPAGSVKDRPAYSMMRRAAERGELKPGDTLIEATSGNTGIALAMVAATLGYRMILIMPENQSVERRALMKAFGAEIILVTQKEGMEGARDLADDATDGRLFVQSRDDHADPHGASWGSLDCPGTRSCQGDVKSSDVSAFQRPRLKVRPMVRQD